MLKSNITRLAGEWFLPGRSLGGATGTRSLGSRTDWPWRVPLSLTWTGTRPMLEMALIFDHILLIIFYLKHNPTGKIQFNLSFRNSTKDPQQISVCFYSQISQNSNQTFSFFNTLICVIHGFCQTNAWKVLKTSGKIQISPWKNLSFQDDVVKTELR